MKAILAAILLAFAKGLKITEDHSWFWEVKHVRVMDPFRCLPLSEQLIIVKLSHKIQILISETIISNLNLHSEVDAE